MKYTILFVLTFVLLVPTTGFSLNAVASVQKKVGIVQVQRQNHVIPARKGLILKDKDLITTLQNGKVTIVFRDGSQIRLYENTKFVIQKTVERKGKKRGFLNTWKLKVGTFWGKFAKGRQKTTIRTPTATCGIKGTDLVFSEGNGNLDVTLSSGSIELRNDDEIITLSPGKMIKGITKTGSFKNKIQDIPYLVQIKPEGKLIIPADGTRMMNFSVQLIKTAKKANFERSGMVFVNSNIDKVNFPPVQLNSRGYASISATVHSFVQKDYDKERLEVYAIMGGKNMMDIGSGFVSIPLKIPTKRLKTIKIDAGTGAPSR